MAPVKRAELAPAPAPAPIPQSKISSAPAPRPERARTDEYYEVKSSVFSALIETIDLSQLARLDMESAREEIRDVVNGIIQARSVVMSFSSSDLLEDIVNDVLGYGPLEPLLARDDIADIMVNSAERTFIEVSGKVQLTGVRFRDNQQLMNICQRSCPMSAAASMNRAPSATRVSPTVPASTSLRHRSRSTARHSQFVSSNATS